MPCGSAVQGVILCRASWRRLMRVLISVYSLRLIPDPLILLPPRTSHYIVGTADSHTKKRYSTHSLLLPTPLSAISSVIDDVRSLGRH
jgi:hypothetical protein